MLKPVIYTAIATSQFAHVNALKLADNVDECKDDSSGPWQRRVNFVAGVGGFGGVLDKMIEQSVKGPNARYGVRIVEQYLRRPEFELYKIAEDPHETKNLANEPGYLSILDEYKKRLREKQIELNDPWRSKWDHE